MILTRKYIYQNSKGGEVEFSLTSDFILNTIEGVSSNTVELSVNKGVNQIGNTVANTTVSSKPITINGAIKTNTEYNRKLLIDTIFTQDRGKLFCIIDEEKYYIDVIATTTPIIENKDYGPKFQFVLNASYPYWKFAEESSVDIRKLIPLFRFPTSFNQLVGGRNLLTKTDFRDKPLVNNSYPIAIFQSAIKLIVGETYTITLKGQLGEGKQAFSAFVDGGYIGFGNLDYIGNGIYRKTFLGKQGTLTPSNIFIYPTPSTITTQSKIEWIKMEVGDKATEWTPAWEDGLPTFKFSEYQRSEFINVMNEGNEEIGMRIEMKALKIASNPKILDVNTGKSIKLNYTFAIGEKVTITTGYNNKKVMSSINGNIFKSLDLVNSTFLQLKPGDNVFKFTSDSDVDSIEVVVYYDEVVVGL